MSGAGAGRVAGLPGDAARTFYNVSDALLPPRDDRPGGGDVDLAPALGAWLAQEGPRAARALVRTLRTLELHAWLVHRRSFSWLPRAERQALLRRWQRSRLRLRRRPVERLASRVHRLAAADPRLRAPAHSPGGP